jgi:acyl-CoA thioester hydrolase
MSTAGFLLRTRVYYEDTDAGGVVFYANYLKFMERARTEWLRDLGFEQDELMQKSGIVFAVTHVSMDFLKPARFNDLLNVSVQLLKLGKASISVHQEIYRGSELLNSADIKLACVDMNSFAPQRIPEGVYTKARALVAETN